MDGDWIFDSVLGYMTSPVWTVPLSTFVENNCVVFDNEEENKLEYTIIHHKYRELVESMLEHFLVDLNISPTTFAKVLDSASEDAQDNEEMERVLVALAATDDFLLFKSIMVDKNLQLEMQVRELYEAQMNQRASLDTVEAFPVADTDGSAAGPATEEEEEEILQRVLRESMAPAAGPTAEEEDAILQEVLRQSMTPSAGPADVDEDAVLQEVLRQSMQDFKVEQPGAWDDTELQAALQASKNEQEELAQRAKKQQAQLAKVVNTSLSDLPPMPAPPKKKKSPKKKKDAATASLVRPRPPPTAWTPSSSSSANTGSNAAAAWVSDAAREAASTDGQPQSSISSTNDPESRKRYLLEQRAKLMQKRTEEREKQLSAFTAESAAANDSAPAPPLAAGGGKQAEGAEFRKILADRLKREVVRGRDQ